MTNTTSEHGRDSPQLCLLGPETLAQQASTTQLRLLTWNVQHSAPARARRQAAWLASQPEADVLVLTEVKDTPGGRTLVQALGEHGYHTIVPSGAGGDYLTVVAAREHALEPLPVALEVLPHRLVSARVTTGSRPASVTGLYVPSRGPKERRNADKHAFQQAVSAYLARLATISDNGLVVVAGDLNVVEPGHQPHYAVFGDWEYRFYSDFTKRGGLIDAFRALHPSRAEHSWFGRGGNGYRFDHIFVTRQHRPWLRGCRYLHEPRIDGLSDHAAMAVTLDLDADLDPGLRDSSTD